MGGQGSRELVDRLSVRMGTTALDDARRVRRGRFVSVLAAALLAECGGQPTEPLATTTAYLPGLIGGWAWVCSSGGLTGQSTCAAATGVTQTWEFRADSVFRWVRSDTLLIEAPFRVVGAGIGIYGDSV